MAHSELATPSATIAVLKRHGLATKKSLGQHFLVDDNVVGRIIALAALKGDEHVVEVGPGIGTLTLALCASAGRVTAVERDSALLDILGETETRCGNLRVIHDDAVTVTAEQLSDAAGPPVALVANLPYSVAATVVLRFFELLPSLASATVMVQAEVAARMAAVPGNKDYGAYTVKLAMLARPAGRFSVSPTCFLPPPRVDSTVLRLERKTEPVDPAVVARASRAAEAGFAQRRKTLRNSLASSLRAPADAVARALSVAGLDGGLRAEMLTPSDFVVLGAAMHEQGLLP